MKICYFVEPFFEVNNPEYRIPTIKSILFPQAKILNEGGHQISMVLAEKTYEKIPEEIKKANWVDFKLVSLDKFRDFSSQLEYVKLTLSGDIENNKKFEKAINEYKRIFIELSPDVIINYESSAEELLKKCSNSRVLNLKFGPFSRPPFPATNYFDERGIYANSPILNIRERELSPPEVDCLRKIRKEVYLTYCEVGIFKKQIDRLRKKYSRIVLLACQIDNYFAYTSHAEYETQSDFVAEIAKNIPKDYCLIVTSHGEYTSQIKNLTELPQNIQIIDTTYPYASQEIALYVDGIITVSSSVGYLAPLWRKPLYVCGKSHLNVFCKSSKLSDFLELCGKEVNQDSILYDVLRKYSNFDKYSIFDLDWLNSKLKGETKEKSPSEIWNQFKGAYRGNRLKQQLKQIGIHGDLDWLGFNIAIHSNISFDMFDTLIERPFIEPWHLFYFVQGEVRQIIKEGNFNFVQYRRMAEAEARRITEGKFEVTLDEIYIEFQKLTGINCNIIDKIKLKEIDAEYAFCRKRKSIEFYYNIARLLKKTITIITDIYLPVDVIENILSKSGIDGYSHLLVSSEIRKRKHNGTIYPLYLALVKSEGKYCYHVGDNKIADYDEAKAHGINAGLIKKSIDNYKNSAIKNALPADINKCGIGGSFLIGILSNKWFDYHYSIRDESLFNGDSYELGYKALGPLVAGFINWLKHIQTNKRYSSIYFLARDGWLLKKAFDILNNTQANSHYLYCSRRSTTFPSIKSIEDAYEVAFQSFDSRTLESFFVSRFGLDINNKEFKRILEKIGVNEKIIVTPLRHRPLLKKIIDESYILIANKSKQEKENLIKYFDEEGLSEQIEKGNRVAFVDLGYSGTMQRCISKIYNTSLIDGYYFLTHFFARKNHFNESFNGFLSNLDEHRSSLRHALNDFVFLFETCFSSPEGSLINIDDNGRKNFIYDAKEAKRIELLDGIHQGCLRFISDIKQFDNPTTFEFSARLAEHLLISFAKNPTKKDASILLGVNVENTFGGGDACLINIGSAKPNSKEIERLIQNSKWKPGARAFYLDTGTISSSKKDVPERNSLNTSSKNRLIEKLQNRPQQYCRDSHNFVVRRIVFPMVKFFPNSSLTQTLLNLIQASIK